MLQKKIITRKTTLAVTAGVVYWETLQQQNTQK
jgi:hypothetical protein